MSLPSIIPMKPVQEHLESLFTESLAEAAVDFLDGLKNSNGHIPADRKKWAGNAVESILKHRESQIGYIRSLYNGKKSGKMGKEWITDSELSFITKLNMAPILVRLYSNRSLPIHKYLEKASNYAAARTMRYSNTP